jgi:hypothetical protein
MERTPRAHELMLAHKQRVDGGGWLMVMFWKSFRDLISIFGYENSDNIIWILRTQNNHPETCAPSKIEELLWNDLEIEFIACGGGIGNSCGDTDQAPLPSQQRPQLTNNSSDTAATPERS